MILLDTCTLLWLTSEQKQLSETAKKLISDNAEGLFVSAISAFEISLKNRLGKLKLPLKPDDWFEQALEFHGINEIAVSSKIAIRSTILSDLHKDLCDRIIIATSQIEHLTLLTPDSLIHQYPDVTIAW